MHYQHYVTSSWKRKHLAISGALPQSLSMKQLHSFAGVLWKSSSFCWWHYSFWHWTRRGGNMLVLVNSVLFSRQTWGDSTGKLKQINRVHSQRDVVSTRFLISWRLSLKMPIKLAQTTMTVSSIADSGSSVSGWMSTVMTISLSSNGAMDSSLGEQGQRTEMKCGFPWWRRLSPGEKQTIIIESSKINGSWFEEDLVVVNKSKVKNSCWLPGIRPWWVEPLFILRPNSIYQMTVALAWPVPMVYLQIYPISPAV